MANTFQALKNSRSTKKTGRSLPKPRTYKSKLPSVIKPETEELDQELEAIKDNSGKFSLATCPLNEKQILQIFQRTPPEHRFTRKGKGAGNWDYVTGVYVKKVLNYVFGFLWDFEVVDKGNVEAGGKIIQVWVQGRLTIRNPETQQPMIIKTQFGRADVKYLKNTDQPLDYGNDLKAATTDALKKCASELGIASDIYGKNEFKEIRGEAKPTAKKAVEVKGEPVETTMPNSVSNLLQLKQALAKRGANTEKQAVEIYNQVTGEALKDLKIDEEQAKRCLFNLLNSPACQN